MRVFKCSNVQVFNCEVSVERGLSYKWCNLLKRDTECTHNYRRLGFVVVVLFCIGLMSDTNMYKRVSVNRMKKSVTFHNNMTYIMCLLYDSMNFMFTFDISFTTTIYDNIAFIIYNLP